MTVPPSSYDAGQPFEASGGEGLLK